MHADPFKGSDYNTKPELTTIGGDLTGPVINDIIPTHINHLVNKQYIDSTQANITSLKVNKDNGIITGFLTLPANPVNDLHAATKQYTDNVISSSSYVHPTVDGSLHAPATGTVSNGKFLKAGSTEGSSFWLPISKDDVGLSNVNNTADADKIVASTNKLVAARTLSISGDLNWSVNFDGDQNVTGTAILSPSGVIAGTYTKAAVDTKGRVTLGSSLAASDIPSLDWSKITSGKPVTAAGYGITDAAPSSHEGSGGLAHPAVTAADNGFMSAADKTKLNNIVASGNIYVHPTGDGNLHVPATGTTNNGKYLKAGATAGSEAWSFITKADIGLNNVENTPDSTKTVASAASAPWTGVSGKPVNYPPSPHSHDASSFTSGTLDIARIPPAAIERLTVVADDTARFALTATTVQNGDTVKVTATDKMYFIKDQNNLSTEAGYEPYSVGAAASVSWTSVTSKPATFPPGPHNHDTVYEAKNANIQAHIINTVNPHSDSKAVIGLGNADNTSDAAKNVLSATKLTTSRTLSTTGDAAWTTTFDGTVNASGTITLATTGVTAGTYLKINVDAKGRVTAGSSLIVSDIPSLDWTKITSGKPVTAAGYGITNIPTILPIGALYRTVIAATPTGFLRCNGASLSITTYANLFAVIGYNYGGVTGTSFNLPTVADTSSSFNYIKY